MNNASIVFVTGMLININGVVLICLSTKITSISFGPTSQITELIR